MSCLLIIISHLGGWITYAVKIVVGEHNEELVGRASFGALGDEHVLGPATAAEVERCEIGRAGVVSLRR